MTANPCSSEWAAARGEKWRAHIPRMEATLAPIDAPLIRALRLNAPCTIAEIGCGGGGTTLELARRAPKGSVVHGFDISPVLVEAARARLGPEEHAVAFAVADMATSAPPEGPYDRLTSRFGVMFFDDPPGAFSNLTRWLKPGGRFAFAVWGPLPENPWMTNLADVVKELIDLPRPDPDAPGPFRYADADRFLGLLAGAGFRDLAVQDWRGELPIGGGLPAEDAADFALAAYSSFGELLAQAGDGVLEAARQALTARLAEHQRGSVVWMDACVHLVTGERPR